MGHWFRSEGLFAASRQTPGQKSKVHTDTLEMELDHDSGHMEGRCLKGQFAGRVLSSLSHDELVQLLEELRATDPQGAFLIEVRLSSPAQDWRGQTSSNRTTQPTVVPMALLAVAAFLLFIFRQRIGLHMGPLLGSKGPFRTLRKSPGQKSEVCTDALKMELDHDSGHMDGRCLKGQFAGKALSSLSQDELLQLLNELRNSDPKGALLVEACLDRRSQDWRGWRSGGEAREEPTQPRGRMTSEEAYDVLGLEEGAREEEIRAAHRRLMMKLHPDQGGSTYLASRINEAKEILVRHK